MIWLVVSACLFVCVWSVCGFGLCECGHCPTYKVKGRTQAKCQEKLQNTRDRTDSWRKKLSKQPL